jgi:hypothetical protein
LAFLDGPLPIGDIVVGVLAVVDVALIVSAASNHSASDVPGKDAIPEEDKDKIAAGHAGNKHGEENNASDEDGVKELINEVLESPWTETKRSNDGRGATAYWDPESGTMVIHDPTNPDMGTVYPITPDQWGRLWTGQQ